MITVDNAGYCLSLLLTSFFFNNQTYSQFHRQHKNNLVQIWHVGLEFDRSIFSLMSEKRLPNSADCIYVYSRRWQFFVARATCFHLFVCKPFYWKCVFPFKLKGNKLCIALKKKQNKTTYPIWGVSRECHIKAQVKELQAFTFVFLYWVEGRICAW